MDWTNLRETLLGSQNQITPPKVDIPALPDVVYRVAKEAQKPDVSVNEIGKIIESDSALTCDLLKYVNSSSMGQKYKASTAVRAASLMGVKRTKLFVLTIASNRLMRSVKSPIIVMKRFAVSSLERALFAKHVAGLLKLDADLAFSAGLLQDLVLPSLTVELTADYSEMLDNSLQSGEYLVDQESQRFQWNHTQVAGSIITAWEFPDDLICCVCLHHGLDEILADNELKQTELLPVALSGLLDDLLNQSPNGYEKMQEIWETIMPGYSLVQIAETVAEQLQELSPDLNGHKTLVENLAAVGV